MDPTNKTERKAVVDVAAWMFNVVTSVGIIIVNKALMATYGFSYDYLTTRPTHTSSPPIFFYATNSYVVVDEEESGSVRKQRVSEQAQRGSEKIGQLQLEVQKLQFLLLQLDDEKGNKGQAQVTDRKRLVILWDYLYRGHSSEIGSINLPQLHLTGPKSQTKGGLNLQPFKNFCSEFHF
ncbi:hypothetical protein GOBAR_AA02520 [Gossypium barbadense]|uniref:Uncharacterized protein n=1 Tax=Gossypium barbadense TaxID=3634 RepID=A0A2P5YR54_GOSBA|nr:hypothetical protein GOBAR_AA02520 [Gossypium barbadense]